jgi:mRNA interferase RelE/StbE
MKVIFSKSIVKDAKKIKDKKTIEKIEALIHQLKKTENLVENPNLKKLKGTSFAFRIRIGDYRLGLYEYNKGEIVLMRLLKRNDIYKVFP